MADILSLITALLAEDKAALEAVDEPHQARHFLAWLARAHPEPIPATLAPALWRLRAVAQGHGCGCALYPGSGSHDPAREQAAGRVQILDSKTIAKAYCRRWHCRCTACSATFNVIQDIGPQRTSYDWQRADQSVSR